LPSRPAAFCDANVLYSALLRDLLIRLAIAGLCDLKWSAEIHEEWMRNLAAARPDIAPSLDRTRALMEKALPKALVHDFPPLPAHVQLPDPQDHHVLAAALHSGIGILLTFNLKDFPIEICEGLEVKVLHPDAWLPVVLRQEEALSLNVIQRMLAPLRNPPMGLPDLAESLRRQGLPATADMVLKLD